MPVQPGTKNLTIIRGIAFDEQVFRAVDDSAAVTGTLNPNVVGTFVLSGTFGGYDLFILSGTPSTFLYYNAAAASYVIARLLTTAALTDYWSPAAPLVGDPSGTYAPHGVNTGTATVDDNPIDLSGFTAQAEVRRTVLATDVTIDLNPSITNGPLGEITIPSISSVITEAYTFTGTFHWDLVLVNNAGSRVGVYIIGTFLITDNITQP